MEQQPEEPKGRLVTKELFDLGAVGATPAAIESLEANLADGAEFVMRHVTGFWGDIDPEDRAANERALKDGGRIFSSFTLSDGQAIWVITEADRSSTTILLPSDY